MRVTSSSIRGRSLLRPSVHGRLLALIGAMALVLSACGGSSESPAPQGTTPIKFSFDWKCGMDWAPLVWGERNGYFGAEHVEVTAVDGDGASAVVPLVASGEQDLAQVSAPPVVLGAVQDLPVTIVGVLMSDSPVALFADGAIKKPEDLLGKKVAVQTGEFEGAVWKAFVKATGLDESQIEEVPASGGSNTLFIDHQVDAFISFYPDLGTPSLTTGRPGEETLFHMKDYVPTYGHTIVVNNRFLQEKPDAVRGFLKAWAQGMKYTIDHPKESVDAVIARCPEVTRENAEFSLQAYTSLWNSQQSKTSGLLDFTAEGVDQTEKVLVDGGLMKDVDLGGLSKPDYLPDPPIRP